MLPSFHVMVDSYATVLWLVLQLMGIMFLTASSVAAVAAEIRVLWVVPLRRFAKVRSLWIA